jgi:hypothetical protein
MFTMITTFSIPWMDFHAPINPDTHSTSRFRKTVRRNLIAPMVDYVQERMGEPQSHGQLLCGQSNCHSIYEIWGVNQHHLQGGHCIPCHN